MGDFIIVGSKKLRVDIDISLRRVFLYETWLGYFFGKIVGSGHTLEEAIEDAKNYENRQQEILEWYVTERKKLLEADKK